MHKWGPCVQNMSLWDTSKPHHNRNHEFCCLLLHNKPPQIQDLDLFHALSPGAASPSFAYCLIKPAVGLSGPLSEFKGRLSVNFMQLRNSVALGILSLWFSLGLSPGSVLTKELPITPCSGTCHSPVSAWQLMVSKPAEDSRLLSWRLKKQLGNYLPSWYYHSWLKVNDKAHSQVSHWGLLEGMHSVTWDLCVKVMSCGTLRHCGTLWDIGISCLLGSPPKASKAAKVGMKGMCSLLVSKQISAGGKQRGLSLTPN